MEQEERAGWLRLVLTPGLGPSAARALLREFGLPSSWFEQPPPAASLAHVCGAELARTLRRAPDPDLSARLQAVEDWLRAAPGRFLLTLADPDYPPGLLALTDPPLLLYAQGRREWLAHPALAIVGSRHATQQGAENAAAFAAHLAGAGWCVVSGMARGIDGAAHRGALDAGGATIAVLGTGIDLVYPRVHRELAGRLAAEGLLLSEYPLGTEAAAENFPRRNRLIAALARGVLVVEAALRSGSLITARLAGELGREVFAIPGSIHSPLSRGCHRLIRDGAKLVESAQDVLEELPDGATPLRGGAPAVADPAAAPAVAPGRPKDAATLLAALGHDPVDFDTLGQRTALDAGALAATLLALELEGRIERLAGNRYQRLAARKA
jgi:DNA processing protein